MKGMFFHRLPTIASRGTCKLNVSERLLCIFSKVGKGSAVMVELMESGQLR
jgi:hypothetical protein